MDVMDNGAEPIVNRSDTLPLGSDATYSQLIDLTDDGLMAKLAEGCDDALAVLFDRYHRLVLSTAFRILRDSGEAEDVMQDVFFEIFRFVRRFDPSRGSVKMWILQYAYHRALNRRRHLNARKFYTQENIEDSESALADANMWFVKYTRAELSYLIQQGLSTIGVLEKRVIELATQEGFAMREIADQTGESFAIVRHSYYRGLRKLRSFVEQHIRAEEKPKPTDRLLQTGRPVPIRCSKRRKALIHHPPPEI